MQEENPVTASEYEPTAASVARFKAAFNAATERGESYDGAILAGMLSFNATLPRRKDGGYDAVSYSDLALQAAVGSKERHDYLPDSLSARRWRPHDWVLDAMLYAVRVDRQFNPRETP